VLLSPEAIYLDDTHCNRLQTIAIAEPHAGSAGARLRGTNGVLSSRGLNEASLQQRPI
jgi:hypothetical protein